MKRIILYLLPLLYAAAAVLILFWIGVDSAGCGKAIMPCYLFITFAVTAVLYVSFLKLHLPGAFTLAVLSLGAGLAVQLSGALLFVLEASIRTAAFTEGIAITLWLAITGVAAYCSWGGESMSVSDSKKRGE